jgi:hypothetical protein
MIVHPRTSVNELVGACKPDVGGPESCCRIQLALSESYRKPVATLRMRHLVDYWSDIIRVFSKGLGAPCSG